MSNTQDIELDLQTRASRGSSPRDSGSGPEVETVGRSNPNHSTSNDQDQLPALQHHGSDIFTQFQRWWQDDRNLDDLERYLQSRSTSDSASRRLLHAYTGLKTQPSGLLFSSLLAFRVCGAEDTSLSSYEYLKLEEASPFTSCLNILKENLHNSPLTALQVCVLTNDVPVNIRFSGYSFVSKIFASTKSLSSTHKAPLQAILHVIQQEWKLSSDAVFDCEAVPRLPKPVLVDLPSSQSRKPGFNLNSSEWTSVKLGWFRDVADFSQDLSVYVWQPHLEPLTAVGASIFVGSFDSGPRHVMVFLKPSKLTGQSLAATTNELDANVPKAVKESVGAETGILSTVLSVYSLLISDTSVLIKKIFNEIDHLSLKGRRNPSVSKMEYTLYLLDCQKCASQATLNAMEILSVISEYVRLRNSLDPSVLDWCRTIRTDLGYLKGRLGDLEIKLIELRVMIKEQLDLHQFRISRTLTILAAIFLPFSFVSGFFGMNLSDPLWNSKSKYSKSRPTTTSTRSATPIAEHRDPAYLSQTLAARLVKSASPTASSIIESSRPQNQTDAIVTAISRSGPHLFAFTTFLIVAFTVTFATIVLPLLVGVIFRTILRSIDRYKGHWRVLVFILGVAVIITTRIFLAEYELQLVYVIIFGVPQGLIALWKLYWARKNSVGKKRWIAYAAILSTSLLYDCAASEMDSLGVHTQWGRHNYEGFYHGCEDSYLGCYLFIGLTGILPPIFLFILGFMSDITVFLRLRMPQWLNKLRTPEILKVHRKARTWVLACVWITLNLVLYFAPYTDLLYYGGFGVAIGLYGLDRFWTALDTHEERIKWAGFLAFFGVSLTLDIVTVTYGLLLATVPFVYIIVHKLWINDQTFITTYLPAWMNWRRPAILPISGTANA